MWTNNSCNINVSCTRTNVSQEVQEHVYHISDFMSTNASAPISQRFSPKCHRHHKAVDLDLQAQKPFLRTCNILSYA